MTKKIIIGVAIATTIVGGAATFLFKKSKKSISEVADEVTNKETNEAIIDITEEEMESPELKVVNK